MLISPVGDDKIDECLRDKRWAYVSAPNRAGIAMYFSNAAISPMLGPNLVGFSLREAAETIKSWNFLEAGYGASAVNAWYNTPERLEKLNAYEPFENYCTRGINFKNKKVGVVGHMSHVTEYAAEAEAIYFIEKEEKEGDYPDSACDYILPQCDVAILTGSSLVNKTLPHLLELCRNAYTILTGPSVPLCPELLDFGIDRIAGMVITDPVSLYQEILENRSGSPYKFGKTFLISKD